MNLFSKSNKKKSFDYLVYENQEACVKLIESGPFGKFFENQNITDLAYNGKSFFVCDNVLGRYQVEIDISNEQITNIIKTIANNMLVSFNNSDNILDISFGDYRLNAIYPTIARINNKKVITFSLRKIVCFVRIAKNDLNLCPLNIHLLLEYFVKSYQSILISGTTGSGKTELQKYLVGLTNKQDRIILIEESYETHIKEIYSDRDVTSWIYDSNKNDIGKLIKTSLRNNPDWIIVAEIRGKEAFDYQVALNTGHSGITTIHSEDAIYNLDRILNMCKRENDIDEKLFLKNLASSLKIGISMERVFDKKRSCYIRRISKICEYYPTSDGYEVNVVFEIKKDMDLKENYHFGKVSKSIIKEFIKYDLDVSKIKEFYDEK